MKQIFFLTILALFFSFSVFAQTEKSPCPTIDVAGGGVVKPGEQMNFTVNVGEEAKNLNLEYKWTVSKGTIIAGQESQTITVDTTGLPDIFLTATVEIKGLPENCPNTFSEQVEYLPRPSSLLLDEFGNFSTNKVKARIEAMYLKLENEPNSQGYIINYGTDKEITNRERQIRKAIDFLKYDSSRVTLVRGGRNANGVGVWTKVWIVPPGADNPQP